MYVEKTTAEERGIIGSKVEGLIIQFDTCQTLLQDIVENGFKFKSGEATECKIDPELLCDRLWIISNLMFDTILQYNSTPPINNTNIVICSHAYREHLPNSIILFRVKCLSRGILKLM